MTAAHCYAVLFGLSPLFGLIFFVVHWFCNLFIRIAVSGKGVSRGTLRLLAGEDGVCCSSYTVRGFPEQRPCFCSQSLSTLSVIEEFLAKRPMPNPPGSDVQGIHNWVRNLNYYSEYRQWWFLHLGPYLILCGWANLLMLQRFPPVSRHTYLCFSMGVQICFLP